MHGQRFALEYASLKPDRHPAMQAREMLRKARFADPGDVFAIHMEAEILLAIVDGDTWLIEGTQRWGLSSHPYEPCTCITPPGRETIVVHNAFNVPDEIMPLAHGKSIRSITGRDWDGAGFCRLLLAAVHGGRTAYGINEAERAAAKAMPHGFRIVSKLTRFGCGWRMLFGRRQHFAWIGDTRPGGDYVTTAEISEAEYRQIEAEYPEARDAGREEGEAFRKKYVDGHAVLLQGWNKYLD